MASKNRKPISNKFKTKKGFIKGEKKMTENAIRYQGMQEDKRHNLEEERRKEKERKADLIGKVGSGVGGAVGSLIGGINDPSWYNLDKQLVKDTAQISFNTPLGAEISDAYSSVRIPGIMNIRLAPTIGDRKAANSAATAIYAYIRQANSGAKNYEPNDIMAYLLQMADAYSYHAYLVRLYSLVLTAKGHNKYYFNTMIKACGGVPENLRANLAQFRAYINSYALRLNALYVPKELSLFARRYWLYSNIFKDQGIKKSQEYVFTPYCLGMYNDTTSTLEMIPYTKFGTVPGYTAGTFEALRYFGDALIDNLLLSADIAIMSGDILKAYGEGGVHSLPTINEDFHIEAVYSQEVLSQIHNLILVGEFDDSDKDKSASVFNISCPAGGIITQGLARTANSIRGFIPQVIVKGGETQAPWKTFNDIILNLYKDDVSPDEVMVATRLMATPDSTSTTYASTTQFYLAGTNTTITSARANDTFIDIEAHGSEVGVDADIYYAPEQGLTYFVNTIRTSFECVVTNATYANMNASRWTRVQYMITRNILLTKFDWAPTIYYFEANLSNTGVTTVEYNTRDAANTASINANTLQNMHYVALLSEYGVPLLGNKVRSR